MHQEKNDPHAAPGDLAWVDQASGVPSDFLRKRDVALVGLEDREGHVGGAADAAQLGPADEVRPDRRTAVDDGHWE